ncbi:unnamed protein product [Cuscuta epithymum]|uniref:F-box domain-containing protein n=1 Tax=Cuscuta epithymum TaxID=186058 RepID=A0AAV0C415_9ASTE|nr:unnamed protein product [Cuscuta epithymum]
MAWETGFDSLPEDCISSALSLTTPEDACRLSLTAPTFRSAAISDAVWERFLPPDYRDIISRSSSAANLLASGSKRDLFIRLCDRPVLIDNDTKSFSLEKKSGKICYMIGARSLEIVWSDTPKYWQWISHPHSRFPEVAELLSVCWLEIRGNINSRLLSPDTNYAAYLVFTLQARTYGLEYQSVVASTEIISNGYEEAKKMTIYLDARGDESVATYPPIVPRMRTFSRGSSYRVRREEMNEAFQNDPAKLPKSRRDGWMEVELGEFFVKNGQSADIVISLMEINSQWKCGLIVEGLEIRPKE